MIKHSIVSVLKIIEKKLDYHMIKWIVVGSLSLALQKVKINPDDIDIVSDKKSIYAIQKLFNKYTTRKLKFLRSETFESYFGELEINGIKVQLMGNLKEKIGYQWTDLLIRLKNPKIITKYGIKVPVSNLEDQLRSYEKSKREKDLMKAEKIKEVLNK